MLSANIRKHPENFLVEKSLMRYVNTASRDQPNSINLHLCMQLIY